MHSGASVKAKGSKKPKYSRFTQQELPACKPLLTPAWVIGTLFVIGAVFIPIGAVALAASNSVVEVVQRYDEVCMPNTNSNQQRSQQISDPVTYPNQTCSVVIQIPKAMQPPVYVYYQLTNFYQNHRRYVKSRSDSQLSGTNISGSAFDVCQPQAYLDGNTSYPITPCGLIAWSLFNDTFRIAAADGSAVTINGSNIAWDSDKNTKFGNVLPQNFNTDPALRGGGALPPNQPLNEDEALMVWMRTAALPTFRKLYGSLTTALQAGSTLSITIQNRYNSYEYDGQKAFVLSTASWLGGYNPFLGVAYITVGSICVALALVFLALLFTHPRPLGDTSYLSWNKHAAAAAAASATTATTTAAEAETVPALDGN